MEKRTLRNKIDINRMWAERTRLQLSRANVFEVQILLRTLYDTLNEKHEELLAQVFYNEQVDALILKQGDIKCP